MKGRLFWILTPILLVCICLTSLCLGEVAVSFSDFLDIASTNEPPTLGKTVLLQQRLPTLFTAISVGIGLPLSGYLLQELFQNPLAGPSILGVTSAAGLGVAVLIFLGTTGGFFAAIHSTWGMASAAFAGSLIAILLILVLTVKMRSMAAIIIIGFMLAGFCSACIGLMQFYSDSVQIQRYVIWGFGSLSGLGNEQIGLLFIGTIVGLSLAYLYGARGLEGLKLGHIQAQSLGVSVGRLRIFIVLISAWLTALCTAFVGPIAFVGLAVPHLVRELFPYYSVREHMARVAMAGVLLMVGFLVLTKSLGTLQLPINLVTAFLGAPLVVFIFMKSSRSL